MSYLKNPILSKTIRSGIQYKFSWGSCLMQNYRTEMQDFLIVNPEVNPRFSLFAVLDGFETEVFPEFVATNFERMFKKTADTLWETETDAEYFPSILDKIENGNQNPELMEIYRELIIKNLTLMSETPKSEGNIFGPEWFKSELKDIQTDEKTFLNTIITREASSDAHYDKVS